MNDLTFSRRQLLGRMRPSLRTDAAGVQGPARARGPGVPLLAPYAELVNTLEYAEQAERVLPSDVYAAIADDDRSVFDRITLRPRMMIPTTDLDLTLALFGATHFAPILAGPIAGQARFHSDGEIALARGAAAASTTMVVSSRADRPIEAIVEAAGSTPPWCQVFAADETAADQMRRAVSAGCPVVCVTVGAGAEWAAVRALVRAADVPVIVKGIRSADDAGAAIDAGAHGLIVSSTDGVSASGAPLILALPPIIDRVAGAVPVLIDGGFRRGTDIIKALAFGATAVLVGRPVIWGLTAYGADGVQAVLQMLQTELARYMAMSGRPTLQTLDRSLLKVHEW